MSKPFTRNEIGNAIMKLRNGKSPGCDKIYPEMIKFSQTESHKNC